MDSSYLKMSKTQKQLESTLKKSLNKSNIDLLRKSINNITKDSEEYTYNNFLDYYKDAFYHCYPLKYIDYNLYINITNEMIKNAISHDADQIKISNLNNIILNYSNELNKINKYYFEVVVKAN